MTLETTYFCDWRTDCGVQCRRNLGSKRDVGAMATFPVLPVELQEMICELLPLSSLFAMCEVSTAWQSAVSNLQHLWQRKLKESPEQTAAILDKALGIHKKMCDGTAFQCVPVCSSLLGTSSFVIRPVYAEGLLVIGIADKHRTVMMTWRDGGDQLDYNFEVAGYVPPEGIALDRQKLAIVRGLRKVFLYRMDGRWPAAGKQAEMTDYPIEAISVFDSFHLVVLVTKRPDDYLQLEFRCSDHGTITGWPIRLGRSAESWRVSSVTSVPGVDSYRLFCVSNDNVCVVTGFVNMSAPDDYFSQECLHYELGPKLLKDAFAFNVHVEGCFIAYQSRQGCNNAVFEVRDFEGQYRNRYLAPGKYWHYRLLGMKGDYLIIYDKLNPAFPVVQVLDHRTGSCYMEYHLPHGVNPAPDLWVMGDHPWPADPTQWWEGRLFAGFVCASTDTFHVTTMAAIGHASDKDDEYQPSTSVSKPERKLYVDE